MTRKALGRGLNALFSDSSTHRFESEDTTAEELLDIDIDLIDPNPEQPRTNFNSAKMQELASSIRANGVVQPILLRRLPEGGRYQLIAGERRWRAAQRARLHAIPAIVREIDDSTSAEIALIENVQRQDLNAIEEAEGYKQLIDRYGHKQDEVAKLVHKSRSHVANLLRLLELPSGVKEMLLRGDISMGHARAIATSEDPENLAREIADKGLSVRQAEVLAKQRKPGAGTSIARASARRERQAADADLAALERQLGDLLGLKVKVASDGNRGAVTLHYSSLDQLDMICQRLSGESI